MSLVINRNMLLQKISCLQYCSSYSWYSKNIFGNFRNFCTYLENINQLPKGSKKVLKSVPKQREEKTFFSRLKQNGYFYLTDPESAETIAEELIKDWKEGYIIEVNPGLGVLTKAILNTGVSHLRVFEKNTEFLPVLQALLEKNSNLEIIDDDFLSLPTIEARTLNKFNNDLEYFLNGIPKYPWNEGVPFRVFCIISSKKSIQFLRFLLASLPNRTSIFAYGQCEFFLLLTEKEYTYMQAEPKRNYSTYRWSTVLYRLFFEIKCLNKFASEIFFPLPVMKNSKKSKHHFYFVKLSPKPDLFTSLINGNKLKEFYFFVRHHFGKRSSLVLPSMDGWVPFCGPRLIKEGMNVFTKFGDLSPNQLVELFNQFSSWPEYESSTFHAALEEFFKRRADSFEDDKNA